MGGISTGVHANPAHGNPTTQCCGWCVVVVVVAHCWVVDQQAQCSDESADRSVRIGRWWCGCWLLVLPGTLLKLAVAGGGGVGGLLFVNYIVDASIFERRAQMAAVLLVPLGSAVGKFDIRYLPRCFNLVVCFRINFLSCYQW